MASTCPNPASARWRSMSKSRSTNCSAARPCRPPGSLDRRRPGRQHPSTSTSTAPTRWPSTTPSSMAAQQLLGLKSTPKVETRTAGERLAVEGIAPASSPGRADDFGGVAPAGARRHGCGACAGSGACRGRDHWRDHRNQAVISSRSYRGSTDEPIRNVSIACAACRPSRIAQTTSDWPRRRSPAANTLSRLVR